MEILDILISASFWAAVDPHRLAADLRDDGRADLRARGRAEPRDRGDHGHRAPSPAGWRSISGCRCGGGSAVALLTGMAFGAAPRRADGAVRAVAACGGARDHAARHRRRLLRLSPRAARGDEPAADRAVPAAGRSRSCRDLPVLGEALFAQTPLTYAAFAVVAADRLRALPHAARPRGPRGGREPRGGRGAGAVGDRRCGSGR